MNYTKWLHWSITRFCNLNCEYCFSKSPYKKGEIIEIDSAAVVKNLNQTGEIFRISFTGGEPFLIKDFVSLCEILSTKHYLSFNTNLTSNKLSEFEEKIDPSKVIKIDASFHFNELQNSNLLNRFIKNFHSLQSKKFNIKCEQVAYPGLLENIDEISKVSIENNLKLKFVPFFGVYNGKKYPETYTQTEIDLFSLDLSILKKFNQKGKFCNAGYNAAVVFSNGNIFPCFQEKTKMSNIYEQIKFNENAVRSCRSKICGCPLNEYDEYLFQKAISDSN